MSEYRSKQTSSGTSSVAFRGTAPATPRKSSTLKQSSVFPSFAMHTGFESKMDEIFGRTNIHLPEGTVEAEYERYISGLPSPRDTDILRFWEVSSTYTIRNERSQSGSYRSIGANFRLYLRSLKTIYRFKRRLFLVNVYSRQRKRLTL